MEKYDPMNLRIFRKVLVGLSAAACLASPSYALGDTNKYLKEKTMKNTPEFYEADQTKEKLIQGFVRDKKGEPVIGANIQIKGKGSGVITDMNGLYQMKVPEKAVLVVSYIGYQTKEVTVDSKATINIVLEEDAKQLDEVVVTAFGISQKKETLVGSVDQIKPTELQAPTSSLSNSFAGRLSGVIAVQRSGEPGADGSNFWIRGKSTFSDATGALIVLDGVEISAGDLNALDPEVIEGFSILKDATATALYGTRGANGVMIVTTKQGADLAKPIINFRFETAVNVMNEIPEMVDGISYMKLYNEARKTRSDSGRTYSDEKITGTMEGKNPYLYPNVNWFDEMFNKLSDSERFNFNIRGGKKAVHYFMSASVKRDGGNLKGRSKDFFSFNNNINVTRYDFVNNLSIKATPSTKISLGLNVSMKDWKGPAKSADEIFNLFKQTFENITEPYSINEVHFQQKDGGIVTKVTSTFRGKTITTEASGNGRLDAVSNALKKAYELKYSLETYQEHALERSSSSKAIAYVGIKKPDGTLAWGAGVDADIIRASIDALVTAINNR